MTLPTMLASAFALVVGAGAMLLWPEPGYERVLPRAEARIVIPAQVMPAAAGDACTPALPAPKAAPEI
jgi:hypothetical protein